MARRLPSGFRGPSRTIAAARHLPCTHAMHWARSGVAARSHKARGAVSSCTVDAAIRCRDGVLVALTLRRAARSSVLWHMHTEGVSHALAHHHSSSWIESPGGWAEHPEQLGAPHHDSGAPTARAIAWHAGVRLPRSDAVARWAGRCVCAVGREARRIVGSRATCAAVCGGCRHDEHLGELARPSAACAVARP